VTQVLFILLLAASVAFFARTVSIFGRALATPTPEPRSRLDDLPGRLVDVGIYFFGQKKVAEEGPQHRTSKHHLFIFWGFLIITIATVDLIVSSVIPGLSLRLLPQSAHHPPQRPRRRGLPQQVHRFPDVPDRKPLMNACGNS